MFIFVENGSDHPDKEVVAVNLNLFEAIQIVERAGRYRIALEKTSGSDATPFYREIANFKTRQDANDCCVEILAAFNNGDKVWCPTFGAPEKLTKGD